MTPENKIAGAVLITGAIVAGAVLIAGAAIVGTILYTTPKNEKVLHLREAYMKTDALLNTSLQVLHHERLHHFGVYSEDVIPEMEK